MCYVCMYVQNCIMSIYKSVFSFYFVIYIQFLCFNICIFVFCSPFECEMSAELHVLQPVRVLLHYFAYITPLCRSVLHWGGRIVIEPCHISLLYVEKPWMHSVSCRPRPSAVEYLHGWNVCTGCNDFVCLYVFSSCVSERRCEEGKVSATRCLFVFL